MRICFLCSEYPPARHGGIGVFTRVLARALVCRGHEVRVAGISLAQAKDPAYEEDGAIRIWRIHTAPRSLGWAAARYGLYRLVSDWAHRGEIDLIEAPDYEGLVAAWPRLPVPVVVRLHGSICYFAAEMGSLRFGPAFWLEHAGLNRADFLCSTSHYTAERTTSLFNLSAERIEVLFNPVEIPSAPPAARASDQVVFSGTLAVKKGVHWLVQAWPYVKAAARGAELHIFGKDGRGPQGGSMRATLEASLNGFGSSVHFHGHVTRDVLFQALDRARVAVFPSLAEAFALAPLEAMAHGCPTVYSRRGSGPELIRDGRDGLLVDPENPREIAAAVARLLVNPDLAARLGAAGRERVRQSFSCDVLSARNIDYYRACLQEFRR
jgi:glycosyltransferase involved in cell wall biosynthesis